MQNLDYSRQPAEQSVATALQHSREQVRYNWLHRRATMSAVSIQVEEDLAALLSSSNQSLEQTARELIVLELFRRETVSSGKAAELLGMSRFEFIRYASRLGIAFLDLTEDEWQAERAQAERL
jgi:predicted HTH domain antitoxin